MNIIRFPHFSSQFHATRGYKDPRSGYFDAVPKFGTIEEPKGSQNGSALVDTGERPKGSETGSEGFAC
jgi:hypothetical protein